MDLQTDATVTDGRSDLQFLQHFVGRQKADIITETQPNPTRRILTSTTNITEDDHSRWDEHLAEISLDANTPMSDRTGFSAAYLLLNHDSLHDQERLEYQRLSQASDKKTCTSLRWTFYVYITTDNISRARFAIKQTNTMTWIR
uniref:Uncharacterized protein n=1 Tax=Glossina austeni TaxID=7395 RepID=A0A1A9UL04_GLOAU